jgi:hypothetical protein
MPRLLILTLHSGEAALPVLRAQLAAQSFQDLQHEIISGLPNRAAHEQLYGTIMREASSFELFLKLDADMTLRTQTALADAVEATHAHPHSRHFAFPVWDCFTESETLGVHLFRSGVTWPPIRDDLFVDPDPENAPAIHWKGPPAPFVNHGELASDFECFCFGVHKFLKVAQRGRTNDVLQSKRHKYFRHMENCARIRDLCRATGAERHRLALAGVLWAMDHPDVATMPAKAELQGSFEREICGDDSWIRRVDRLSGSVVAWRLALVRSLGFRRAFE